MKKSVALILALVLAVGILSTVMPASAAYTRMWVKTPNGKSLNVRDSNNQIIGRMAYGTEVIVTDEEDDWAIIMYGSMGDGWVKEKFLVDYNPGKYHGDGDSSGSKTSGLTDSTLGAQTVNGLNTQYQSLVYVSTPYTVKVVPDTKTGTARLRWAPSKFSTLIAYVPANYQLTVLASNKDWLMVRDESNGKIGYIAAKYTAAVQ